MPPRRGAAHLAATQTCSTQFCDQPAVWVTLIVLSVLNAMLMVVLILFVLRDRCRLVSSKERKDCEKRGVKSEDDAFSGSGGTADASKLSINLCANGQSTSNGNDASVHTTDASASIQWIEGEDCRDAQGMREETSIIDQRLGALEAKMSHVQIGLEALVDELRSKPTAPVVMETQQVESAGFGGLLDVLTGGTATHTPIPSRAPSRAGSVSRGGLLQALTPRGSLSNFPGRLHICRLPVFLHQPP